MNLNGDYYMWLLDQIDVLYGRHENYLLLMQHLFTQTYVYALEMDKNRASAGLNLRSLFAEEAGVYLDDVRTDDCSVLEMLIALANDISFDTSTTTSEWFWVMIDNLHLASEDDEDYDRAYVDQCLRIWMNRTYDAEGCGSLFPIPDFDGDMRKLEIWDQKNAYLRELYPAGRWLD